MGGSYRIVESQLASSRLGRQKAPKATEVDESMNIIGGMNINIELIIHVSKAPKMCHLRKLATSGPVEGPVFMQDISENRLRSYSDCHIASRIDCRVKGRGQSSDRSSRAGSTSRDFASFPSELCGRRSGTFTEAARWVPPDQSLHSAKGGAVETGCSDLYDVRY